ncbi:MAG: hypothetical protein ACUVQY_05790 [Thermoproteota archaeon]
MWGTEEGGKVTDIVMKAKEKIMLGGKTFGESDVIAIIEVKSTTYTDNEEILMDRFNKAMEDLKKHIGLDEYETAQCGVAVAFGYNPVDMLRSWSYPDSIGPYKNPY